MPQNLLSTNSMDDEQSIEIIVWKKSSVLIISSYYSIFFVLYFRKHCFLSDRYLLRSKLKTLQLEHFAGFSELDNKL